MSQKFSAYTDFQVPFTVSKDGFYFVMADVPNDEADEDDQVIVRLPKEIYVRFFDSCCKILADLHVIPFDPDARGIAYAVMEGLTDTGETMQMFKDPYDEDSDEDESDVEDFRVLAWSNDSSFVIEMDND